MSKSITHNRSFDLPIMIIETAILLAALAIIFLLGVNYL